MSTDASAVKDNIAQRQLTQWHLVVASLLAALASEGGIFNQAFLNRCLQRSMRDFILPWLTDHPDLAPLKQRAAEGAPLLETVQGAMALLQHEFSLAGELEALQNEDGSIGVRVVSSTCRWCPIGVGSASMQPGATFCPFPQMFEDTVCFLLPEGETVKMGRVLEGTRTHIVTKADGACTVNLIPEE